MPLSRIQTTLISGETSDSVLRSLLVPAAPTGVTASPGNAQAVVSWTAPAVMVPPLTDYLVQYSSDSGSNWTTFSDGTSTAAAASVTGLTNGTAYTFRVAAVNALGTGAYSTASAAVTPTAILLTGLQLWLDAADANTLYNATTGGSLVAADGGVARWEDKSGNGRHATQATSANRPARKTAVQGGLDVLRFDGSNDLLQSADFLDLSVGQAMTIIAAIKRSATNATHTIVSKYTKSNAFDGNTADGWGLRILSTNAMDFFGGTDEGAGNSVRVTNSTVDASAFTVLSLKVSAGAISGATLYRNSSTIPSSATASGGETLENTSFPVLVGALMYTNNVPLQYLNGDIAELIIYDSALSDANRGLVESYLMSKWAIT